MLRLVKEIPLVGNRDGEQKFAGKRKLLTFSLRFSDRLRLSSVLLGKILLFLLGGLAPAPLSIPVGIEIGIVHLPGSEEPKPLIWISPYHVFDYINQALRIALDIPTQVAGSRHFNGSLHLDSELTVRFADGKGG